MVFFVFLDVRPRLMANMFRMYLRGAGGLNELDWDDTPIIPSCLGVDDGPHWDMVMPTVDPPTRMG